MLRGLYKNKEIQAHLCPQLDFMCVYTAPGVDRGHSHNPGQEKQSKGSVEDYQLFSYMVLSGQADHMLYVSKQ